MAWFAQAPSNIALIKYMGKENLELNLPINPSLSYTLPHLMSSVELESHPGKQDLWEPLTIPGASPLTLSVHAQQRFLSHLARIKTSLQYQGSFIVRSTNNFPHSSGLASSASSFAALTKCTFMALSDLKQKPLPSIETQAQWSRLGSGSSCRSFFAPWVLWDHETVKSVELPYPTLLHQAILISQAEKQVPSKEAHQRVQTSVHYRGRAKRAKDRLRTLLNAFETQDWKSAYLICWREFQDLHALFSSAKPSFSYMNAETNVALEAVQALWEEHDDGPLVTMDAGPNIHLLYREDQAEMALTFKQRFLLGRHDVL